MSKRKYFSVAEKVEIIEKSKVFKGTKVDLAKSLGIAYSTLQTILKQEVPVELESEKLGNLSKKRKTLKSSPFEELEHILFDWFKQARAAKIPINGSILKEKALEISSHLEMQNFTASNGWLDRFKKRHNLSYKFISGEAGGVNTVVVKEWMEETLPSLVCNYAKKDIFNADETGLFFNLFPDRTYTIKGEKCHGGKLSKVRLTVLLCANSDGTEKLTPFVIGKSQNPRCFKNVKSLPTDYHANQKAWMTRNLFEVYVKKLDMKMRLQKRKIILFVDQCTAHANMNLKNVRIELLPPNCTSLLQPCDLGVIRSFKMNYRKQLVRKALSSLNSGEFQDAWKKKINVLDALHLISSAWDRVDGKCISNAFLKGGFSKHDINGEAMLEQLTLEDYSKEDEFKHIENVDEYIDCDKDVITSTDDVQIIDFISQYEIESEDDTDEDPAEDIVPSPEEAIESLKTLKNFLTGHENQETNLQKLACIENSVYEIVFKKKKQSKITQFFK